MKTMTSRNFNQDVGGAKRMAKIEPVIITDRGRPSHVLLSHEEYERLRNPNRSVVDVIADPRPEADFDFEIPRLNWTPRPADLD